MKEIARRNSGEPSAWRISRFPESEDAEPIYTLESEPARLVEYWKVLVKRHRLLVAVFIAVVAVGIYLNYTATTLYTASSTLKIEPQNPTVTGVSTGAYDRLPVQNEGSYDYYGTQFALLQSRTLAERVIAELNLESHAGFGAQTAGVNPVTRLEESVFGTLDSVLDFFKGLFPSKAKTNSHNRGSGTSTVSSYSISRYLRFLEVKPVKNTRLVEVQFNTPDPALSQTLANAHATSFIRMILESRFELTKEARDFLDKKNAELKAKLERAEGELNRFRQAYGVVSLDKGENIVVERLVDLNKQLTAARAARIQAESLYRVVQNKNFNNLAEVINHTLIQQLKSNIANLEAEKARLSNIFTEHHPRIVELDQQIRNARRSLNHEVSTIVRGIESNYNAAKAREEALQAEAEKQQHAALELKQVGVQYAVLQEEVNVNRSLYESVLKRLHETNVSNDLAVSNMQIVQRAEMPLNPSFPRTGRNLMVAVTLGLLLGVGLVFGVEYLDSKLHTPQEVWNAVALNTIGVIPHLRSVDAVAYGTKKPLADKSQSPLPQVRSSPNGHLALAGLHNRFSIIAESFRTVRTALMLSQAERPPQVILLTSPCPADGKTVTALNLGIVLAQGGHKVLIIDADLRKGRCHKLLGLANFHGLSNLLTGHLSINEAILKTPVEGLSLLSRGPLPPNPADLLCSRRMSEILQTLRQSADFVLVDSPPVNAVSDAALLSAVCDGVLLVLNSQQTIADSARRAVESMTQLGANIIGVILNGVDLRNPDYRDFRSYYPPYAAANDKDDFIHDEKIMGSAPEFTNEKGEPPSMDSRLVAKEFMDHLVAKLGDAVGPMASTIVRTHAAALGESLDAFPQKKVNMLIERVSEEILDRKLKREFQGAVSEGIRTLDSF